VSTRENIRNARALQSMSVKVLIGFRFGKEREIEIEIKK